MSGLKDEICAHILMSYLQTWLEATKRAKEAQHTFSSETKKPSFFPCPKPTNTTLPTTPLKIEK